MPNMYTSIVADIFFLLHAVIGALQAHTDHFKTHEAKYDKTRSVSVVTDEIDSLKDEYTQIRDGHRH